MLNLVSARQRTGAGPRDLDAARLIAWRSMREASEWVVSRVSAEMEETCGLAFDWYGILLHIYEGGVEGRLPQNELERHLHLSQSGISRMVSKMQNAGLIRREQLPHNRRSVYVVLTDHGRDVFLRATPVHHAAVQRHFGAWLSDTDATAINKGLQKVLRAGDAHSPEPSEDLDQLVTFGKSVLALTSDTVVVSDAILVRDALEPLLLVDASRHVTDAAINDMQAIVIRMSRLIDQPEEFFRADWELHRMLTGCCHNEVLQSAYLALLEIVSSHLDKVVPTTNLGQYLYERLAIHAQLVDAVACGDEQQVRASARRHNFTDVRARLVDTPAD